LQFENKATALHLANTLFTDSYEPVTVTPSERKLMDQVGLPDNCNPDDTDWIHDIQIDADSAIFITSNRTIIIILSCSLRSELIILGIDFHIIN
jgi:hypothetical protein